LVQLQTSVTKKGLIL